MKIYHGHPSPASIEKVREAAPSHTHGAEWSDQKMTPHDWPYILDNGAFTAYKNGNAWDVDSFVQRLAEIETRMPRDPDFVVLPDVVTSPGETLKRSRQWQKLLDQLGLPMALACQDGCDPETMASYARELGCCALFIGGTTEWKQSNAEAFVDAAHAAGLDAHIGRPSDLSWAKRIGADSVDTTSIVQNESFGKLRTLEQQQTLATDGGEPQETEDDHLYHQILREHGIDPDPDANGVWDATVSTFREAGVGRGDSVDRLDSNDEPEVRTDGSGQPSTGTGRRWTWRGAKRMEVRASPCPRCGGETEYREPTSSDNVRSCTECPWKVLVSGRTGGSGVQAGDRDE